MPTGTPPTAAQPAAPKPKLRWYQFSLWSLMLFVLVCAIACSWFATRLERAMRQRAAVEAITKAGGDVLYDDLADADGHLDPSKLPWPRNPGWLERLLGRDFCHSVRTVECSPHIAYPPGFAGSREIPADTLQRLKDLPDLRDLDLSGTSLTDMELEYVLPLVQLRHLDLSWTRATDAGVKRLHEALPNCKIAH